MQTDNTSLSGLEDLIADFLINPTWDKMGIDKYEVAMFWIKNPTVRYGSKTKISIQDFISNR